MQAYVGVYPFILFFLTMKTVKFASFQFHQFQDWILLTDETYNAKEQIKQLWFAFNWKNWFKKTNDRTWTIDALFNMCDKENELWKGWTRFHVSWEINHVSIHNFL